MRSKLCLLLFLVLAQIYLDNQLYCRSNISNQTKNLCNRMTHYIVHNKKLQGK